MDDSATLRRLSDIEAIRQLTARYNFAFDTRNESEFIACWTPDGYVERLNSYPRAQGHAELAALARNFPVAGRHISSDFVIEIAGDSATSQNYCIYLDMTPPCEISMVGTYRDRLVRTAQGWKFAERVFEPHTMRASEATINIGNKLGAP